MTEPHTPQMLADRLLAAFEDHLLPATRTSVARGNKVFGAVLLRKDDLGVVLAGTNNETENPLWHGEVHTIKLYHEMPERPAPGELVFLSSHEPCPMCLSAITWAGFDNFSYLFSYEDSRDAFSIPHDLKIMGEVFKLPDGDYRAENAFWRAQSLSSLIAEAPEDERAALERREGAIRAAYDDLSAQYQATKGENEIPLA
jgi:tRNA(Arg) A34 adenosine deaminase TadA